MLLCHTTPSQKPAIAMNPCCSISQSLVYVNLLVPSGRFCSCMPVSPKGFLAARFGSILLDRVEHKYLRPCNSLSVVNRTWCLHFWLSDCNEAPSYRWDADAVTAFDAPLWNSWLGCKWLAFWIWRDTKGNMMCSLLYMTLALCMEHTWQQGS